MAHELGSHQELAPREALASTRGALVKRAFGIGAVLSYPLLVVWSLSTGLTWIALLISAVLVAVHIPRQSLRYAVAVLLVSVAGLSWLRAEGESIAHVLVFAPPVVINLGLAWLFGRTLLPGREPLIASFARLERQGMLPYDLARHARNVTILWAGFTTTMACVSLALAALQWLAAWSLFTGVVNYALAALLLVGEHTYRRARYAHHPHVGIAQIRHLRFGQRADLAGKLPMLPRHMLSDEAAWRAGRFVSAAELIGHAQVLAQQLPAQHYVMNLCRDRYHFTVAFLASIIAGKTNVLPPNFTIRTLDEIRAQYGDVCCIADHRDIPRACVAIDITACNRFDAAVEMPRVDENQVVAVLFTSGSTGHSTPHEKRWGALAQGAFTLGARLEFADRDVVLGGVPPQHMYGLETTIMLPLQCGGVVHAASPLLPPDIYAAVVDLSRSAWLMTTPLQLRACAEQDIDLSALRRIVSATMPLDKALASRIETRYGCQVHEIYGCTEIGMIATRRTTAGEAWMLASGLRLRTEGQIAIVDGGHAQRAHRLADHLLRIDRRHFILLGRDSDLVKIAGKRTSLEALNRALREIPGVQDAIYLVPPQSHEKAARPIAFAIAPNLTPDEIIRRLRERLDPIFLPRPLYLVDALPRTPTGKISRVALEELREAMRHPASAIA